MLLTFGYLPVGIGPVRDRRADSADGSLTTITCMWHW